MKIKFIGVGGAFAPISKGNSNMLIESDCGHKMMIDFGQTAPYILRDELGLDFRDIEAVYISHLHSDHACIEQFAFSRYFLPKEDINKKTVKPILFMNSELMHEAWEHSWRGGLESVEGKVNNLTDYFECHAIKDNVQFNWRGIEFQPVQTLHISSGYAFKNSYGLLIRPYKIIEATGSDLLQTVKEYRSSIFLTTDTQFCPYQLRAYYNQSDIIFHDCETLKGFKSHVHAHYNDLNTLPLETKSKMWLYHYGDKIETVKDDGFLGFVDKFQQFEF